MPTVPNIGTPDIRQSRRDLVTFSGFRGWLASFNRQGPAARAFDNFLKTSCSRRTLLGGTAGAAAVVVNPEVVIGNESLQHALQMAFTRMANSAADEFLMERQWPILYKLFGAISSPAKLANFIKGAIETDPEAAYVVLDNVFSIFTTDPGHHAISNFGRRVSGAFYQAITSPELPPVIREKLSEVPNVKEFLKRRQVNDKPDSKKTSEAKKQPSALEISLRRDATMMIKYFQDQMDLMHETQIDEDDVDVIITLRDEITKRENWIREIDENYRI